MFQFLRKFFSKQEDNQLREIIARGAFLVDVRTPKEFATGSVRGAKNIPLDQIPQNLSLFKERGDIIVFCKSGIRSARAQEILQHHGIEQVYNGVSWLHVERMVR